MKPPPTYVFSSLDEACRGLLLTTSALLTDANVDYVVAGGWVPIILGSPHPTLKHPGTRDVDVLLLDDETGPKAAADVLLRADFRPSAKHEFQLLRDARVADDKGGERTFVFNIDLMHPKESAQRSEMFADILDFGVKDDYDPSGSRHMKSIAFKSAMIVVEEKLFESAPVRGRNFDGRDTRVDVPLLNLPALVLSKCESASNAKRTRDAFDIYFALTGPNGAAAATELRRLAEGSPDVSAQLDKLRQLLRDEKRPFDLNVFKHTKPFAGIGSSPARTVMDLLGG